MGPLALWKDGFSPHLSRFALRNGGHLGGFYAEIVDFERLASYNYIVNRVLGLIAKASQTL